MTQASSSRWRPTPEQLLILEKLYRCGVRTPDASQIQQMTAHLSCYGRVEGKNVFYWFQNHKARERQKLRSRPSMHHRHLLLSGYPFPLLPHHRRSHCFEDAPVLHHRIIPSQFLHQDETQGLNLLCKLETRAEEPSALTNTAAYAYGWTVMMKLHHPTNPPCREPLKTLDLFPTKSTGLSSSSASPKRTAQTNLPGSLIGCM